MRESTGAPGGVAMLMTTSQVELCELTAERVAAVYDELLRPAFAEAELLSVDDLRELYLEPDAPEPSAVLLHGDRPVAVMLGEWFADGRVLLLAYVAVTPHVRSAGLGGHLVGGVLREWASRRPGAITLAEVEDPRCHPGDASTGDPLARLRFYERLGARLLPLPYVQPSLRPGLPRVTGLLLLRLDSGGPAPPGLLRTFLADYFTGCEGPTSLDEPGVQALLQRLEDAGQQPLLSPTDYAQLEPR